MPSPIFRLPRLPTSPREIGGVAQLLFEWPIRRAPRLALPFCILVAILIQAAAMVFFSIRYPVPKERTILQPRFYFLPSGSEFLKEISPWLEANDPAVFSPLRAAETAVPSPPPVNYRPSYEDAPPSLKPLPPLQEEEDFAEPPLLPLLRPSLPVIPVVPSTVPPFSRVTSLQWMDALASRTLLSGGDAGPSSPDPAILPAQPSLYQVEIGPEGIPLSCVVIDPSGDPEADASGRARILGCRFQPADTPSWGRVEILWAVPSPPPPSQPGPTTAPTP